MGGVLLVLFPASRRGLFASPKKSEQSQRHTLSIPRVTNRLENNLFIDK